MAENENDVAWREYNIHNDYDKTTTSDNNQSQEEDNNDDEQQQPVDIFATQEDPYDIQEYTFPDKNHGDDDNNDNNNEKTKIIITLREQKDYDVSTGMSVWKGSEILCQYLIEHPRTIRGKKVLEVGAGVGLCGVVSAKVLGASSVLLTDGDQLVLGNLRHNMGLNELLGSSSTTATTTTTNNESSSTSCPCSCSCPQLIWGKSTAASFEKKYGKQDVILATDCVYVTKSVRPLFETVSQLLVPKKNNKNGNADDDDVGGVFLFVNSCASICPLEEVLRIGKDFGFVASEEEMWCQQPGEGDENDPVYVFRRC